MGCASPGEHGGFGDGVAAVAVVGFADGVWEGVEEHGCGLSGDGSGEVGGVA